MVSFLNYFVLIYVFFPLLENKGVETFFFFAATLLSFVLSSTSDNKTYSKSVEKQLKNLNPPPKKIE